MRIIQQEKQKRSKKQEVPAEIFYQPVFESKGTLLYAEALARWQKNGAVLAATEERIAQMEQSGEIVQFDLRNLKTVCQVLQSWKKDGYKTPCIALNMSVRTLEYPGIAEKIRKEVKNSGVSSARLEIEAIETKKISRKHKRLCKNLCLLQKQGIRIALDDFGKGYAGLQALTCARWDTLKIDKELVWKSSGNRKRLKQIRSLIRWCQARGIRVTAEGVETDAQKKSMQEAGADALQGYYLEYPLPEKAFREKWLTAVHDRQA